MVKTTIDAVFLNLHHVMWDSRFSIAHSHLAHRHERPSHHHFSKELRARALATDPMTLPWKCNADVPRLWCSRFFSYVHNFNALKIHIHPSIHPFNVLCVYKIQNALLQLVVCLFFFISSFFLITQLLFSVFNTNSSGLTKDERYLTYGQEMVSFNFSIVQQDANSSFNSATPTIRQLLMKLPMHNAHTDGWNEIFKYLHSMPIQNSNKSKLEIKSKTWKLASFVSNFVTVYSDAFRSSHTSHIHTHAHQNQWSFNEINKQSAVQCT